MGLRFVSPYRLLLYNLNNDWYCISMCRYMGGKGKIGKHIAKRIKEIEEKIPIETETYFEPFIGMCGVMRNMGSRKKIACDLSPDIICLWRAMKDGWKPPNFLTQEEVIFQKESSPSALRCFAAYGCSYGGICFSSYLGKYNGGREEIDRSSRSIIRVSKQVDDVVFLDNTSYDQHNPKNMTIYCDPPYITASKAVLKMDNFNSFDHEHFWSTMRKWVHNRNIVIVSEFTAPDDFISVWEKNTVGNVKHNGYKLEKLFMHESQAIYLE